MSEHIIMVRYCTSLMYYNDKQHSAYTMSCILYIGKSLICHFIPSKRDVSQLTQLLAINLQAWVVQSALYINMGQPTPFFILFYFFYTNWPITVCVDQTMKPEQVGIENARQHKRHQKEVSPTTHGLHLGLALGLEQLWIQLERSPIHYSNTI